VQARGKMFRVQAGRRGIRPDVLGEDVKRPHRVPLAREHARI
jgi:hypothetical protein